MLYNKGQRHDHLHCKGGGQTMTDPPDAIKAAYEDARRYQPSKQSAPEWETLSTELREVIIRAYYAGQHDAIR